MSSFCHNRYFLFSLWFEVGYFPFTSMLHSSFNSKQIGGRFNIKIPSYQVRKCHRGDEMSARMSYFHIGNADIGKTACLTHWGPVTCNCVSSAQSGANIWFMLTYCQFDPQEHISMIYFSKFHTFHSRKKHLKLPYMSLLERPHVCVNISLLRGRVDISLLRVVIQSLKISSYTSTEPRIMTGRTARVLPQVMIHITGLILGLRPANERRRYFVTTSLIGWAQA